MKYVSFILAFLLIFNISLLISQPGRWVQVRQADWEFGLDKVFFIDEQKGWILGRHYQLLYTTNGGENWHRYQFSPEIAAGITGYFEDICFIGENKGWIVGFDGMILHTSDGGTSWEFQDTGVNSYLYGCSFITESQGWAVGYLPPVILSTNNGGASWNIQSTPSPDSVTMLYDVCFVDSLKGWMVGRVGRNGIILHTNDGGKTLIEQYRTSDIVCFYGVQFLDDKNGWVVGPGSSLARTDDGGETWTIYRNAGGTYANLVSLYFFNPDTGWVAGGPGILMKTTDGGESWESAPSPLPYVRDIYFVNDSLGWVVADYGTIMATRDGGNNWHWQMNFPSAHVQDIWFTNPDNGWAMAGYLIRSTDGGMNWEIFSTEIYGNDLCFINEDKGVILSVKDLYITEDGGLSWGKKSDIFEDRMHEIQFINKNRGWAFGFKIEQADTINWISSTYAFITNDGGLSWEKLFERRDEQTEKFYFVDSLRGWATGSEGRIYRTVDGGYSWEFLHELLPGQLGFSDIFFVDSLYGWVAGWGEIWGTTDGGLSWKRQLGPIWEDMSKIHFFDRNEGWISSTGGLLFYTTNGGEDWEFHFLDKAYWLWDMYFLDRNHGWVCGMWGSIYKWQPELSVDDISQSIVPTEYKLFQNYPNPFNPDTEIRYQLPEATHVKLEIYNLLGQKIRTLIDGQKPTGSHTIRWDGRDETGAAVSSGVYLYLLTAGRFCETRKMVVLR